MARTKDMTLRLMLAQARALEAVARVDEIPVSEAVRRAIDAHIEARKADDAFRQRVAKIIDEDREILHQLAQGPGGEDDSVAQRAVQRARSKRVEQPA